jgi:hypothetical protein
MDTQTIINIAAGAVLSIFGWLARALWDAVSKLREDIHELEVQLPSTYIMKQDFQDAVNNINLKLDKIWDKLEDKADR